MKFITLSINIIRVGFTLPQFQTQYQKKFIISFMVQKAKSSRGNFAQNSIIFQAESFAKRDKTIQHAFLGLFLLKFHLHFWENIFKVHLAKFAFIKATLRLCCWGCPETKLDGRRRGSNPRVYDLWPDAMTTWPWWSHMAIH